MPMGVTQEAPQQKAVQVFMFVIVAYTLNKPVIKCCKTVQQVDKQWENLI